MAQQMKYDLEKISQIIIERIEEILYDFSIEYYNNGDYISLPCPIHGGDNPNGCSILLRDIGNWTCFTQNCHEEYDSSIIGFIEALLSTQYSRKVNRAEAIDWCARFTGELEPTEEKKVDTNFIHLLKYIQKEKEYTNNFVPRDIVRSTTKIPADYFIQRGYSHAIIIEYDVGFCNNPNKSMYNRAVVPLYDETGQFMLGCIGRSIFEKCEECNRYHNPEVRCPIGKIERINTVKWKFSPKFDADLYLYNMWKAKECIIRDRMAILVEGTGDVWRLEETGIHHGLALLGSKFTDYQCESLEETGILNLVIATDNNEAGLKIRKNIEGRCKRMFNIYHVNLEENDIGDTKIEDVCRLFNPIIKYITQRI